MSYSNPTNPMEALGCAKMGWGCAGCFGVIVVLALILGVMSSLQPTGTPQAQLVQVRIVPYTTASGQQAQMVLTDWRSTGTAPVKTVHADITPYGADGGTLSSGASDYTIFHTESDARAVKPGETYREPNGDGFILLPLDGRASKVNVTITRVK